SLLRADCSVGSDRSAAPHRAARSSDRSGERNLATRAAVGAQTPPLAHYPPAERNVKLRAGRPGAEPRENQRFTPVALRSRRLPNSRTATRSGNAASGQSERTPHSRRAWPSGWFG